MMTEIGILLMLHALGFGLMSAWMHNGMNDPLPEPKPKQSRGRARKYNPDDYWDEGEVNYATGEIEPNGGAVVRHPKNVDRAHSGSVERFHDGGW